MDEVESVPPDVVSDASSSADRAKALQATIRHLERKYAAEVKANETMQIKLDEQARKYQDWVDDAQRARRALEDELRFTKHSLEESQSQVLQLSLDLTAAKGNESVLTAKGLEKVCSEQSKEIHKLQTKLDDARRQADRSSKAHADAQGEVERLTRMTQLLQNQEEAKQVKREEEAEESFQVVRGELEREQAMSGRWKQRYTHLRERFDKLEAVHSRLEAEAARRARTDGQKITLAQQNISQLEQMLEEEKEKQKVKPSNPLLLLHEKANYWLEKYRFTKMELEEEQARFAETQASVDGVKAELREYRRTAEEQADELAQLRGLSSVARANKASVTNLRLAQEMKAIQEQIVALEETSAKLSAEAEHWKDLHRKSSAKAGSLQAEVDRLKILIG